MSNEVFPTITEGHLIWAHWKVYTFFKQFFLMFSLSNFKLKEMGNRNLLGILSSPIKSLCWRCKHTSSQIEPALLCAVKTGNVLKPISEQNPSTVFSAASDRSHLLKHSANCLIQVFNVSEFQHFLYMSTDLSTESCLFWKSFQTLRTIVLPINLPLASTYEERSPGNQDPGIIKNSDNPLNSDSFLFPTL